MAASSYTIVFALRAGERTRRVDAPPVVRGCHKKNFSDIFVAQRSGRSSLMLYVFLVEE